MEHFEKVLVKMTTFRLVSPFKVLKMGAIMGAIKMGALVARCHWFTRAVTSFILLNQVITLSIGVQYPGMINRLANYIAENQSYFHFAYP